MQLIVQFAHALADETRWRILQLVFDEALCVCELADILGMPQSTVSSHLQVIRKAQMLDSERCEKWIYYRLRGSLKSLLTEIRGHFEISPAEAAAAASDAKKARKRLAQRDESCCPGPRELAGSSTVTTTIGH